jgi:hypothetical protein
MRHFHLRTFWLGWLAAAIALIAPMCAIAGYVKVGYEPATGNVKLAVHYLTVVGYGPINNVQVRSASGAFLRPPAVVPGGPSRAIGLSLSDHVSGHPGAAR